MKKNRRKYIYALILLCFLCLTAIVGILKARNEPTRIALQSGHSTYRGLASQKRPPNVFLRDQKKKNKKSTQHPLAPSRKIDPSLVARKQSENPLNKTGQMFKVVEENTMNDLALTTSQAPRALREEEVRDLCATIFESRDELPDHQFQRMIKSLNCSQHSRTMSYRTAPVINAPIQTSPWQRPMTTVKIQNPKIIGRPTPLPTNNNEEFEKFSKDLKIMIDECIEETEIENADFSITSLVPSHLTEDIRKLSNDQNLEMYLIRTLQGEVYLFIFTQTTQLVYKFSETGIRSQFSVVT